MAEKQTGLDDYGFQDSLRKRPTRDKVKIRQYENARTRALKEKVIGAYGRTCACCGEDRVEFLCIDHTNGGGSKHRRELGIPGGRPFWQWLVKNGFPPGFRVLCNNCNLALGHYGYCPHVTVHREARRLNQTTWKDLQNP